MAIRYSTGLRNFLNEGGSLKQALANGVLEVYSGAQPSSADAAPTGTLLYKVTDSSGAHTNEVQATGSLTVSGTSGSVDTVTVNSIDILGGAVTNTGAADGTATAVATAINNNPKNILFTASASGAVVTIKAKPGLGTLANGWAVSGTATTTSLGTLVNMGSGVAGVNPANGLKFGDSAAGVLTKLSTQTWTGVGLTDGAMGYFRFKGSVADAGAADSGEAYLRMDGNIATSGADLNMSSTAVATGATQTINSFSPTLPASA